MPSRYRRMAPMGLLCGVMLVAVGACGSPPAGFSTVDEVRREIEQAKSTTPMPPGATFRPIKLDESAAYEAGSGTNPIQFQAMCAWFGYWLKGLDLGDQAQVEQAQVRLAELRSSGMWRSGQQYLDDITERAKLGDPSGLQQMIQNNCK